MKSTSLINIQMDSITNQKKIKNYFIIRLFSLCLLNLLMITCHCNSRETHFPTALVLDIQLVIQQTQNNRVSYWIENKTNDTLQDVSLAYTNTSEDEAEKRVTLNSRMEGKINFSSIGAHDPTEEGHCTLDFQGTTKAQFLFKIFHHDHFVKEALHVFTLKPTQQETQVPTLEEASPAHQEQTNKPTAIDATKLASSSQPPQRAETAAESPLSALKPLHESTLGTQEHAAGASATTSSETGIDTLFVPPNPKKDPTTTIEHPTLTKSSKQSTKDQEELLFEAVKLGDITTVKNLVEDSVDINCQNIDQETPMHWALYQGHVEIATLLLRKGAKINDVPGNITSPLRWAIAGGHPKVIILLLDQGGIPIDYRDDREQTLLNQAAYEGHKKIVALLLDRGALPNCQDITSSTPLHRATEQGHHKIVALLLKHGAIPNVIDQQGRTPLHWAAYQGNKKIVKLLLGNGATSQFVDHEGFTPIKLVQEQIKKATTESDQNHYQEVIDLITAIKTYVD